MGKNERKKSDNPEYNSNLDKLNSVLTQKIYGYFNLFNSKISSKEGDKIIAKKMAKIETYTRRMPDDSACAALRIISNRMSYCPTSEAMVCIGKCIDDLDLFPLYAPVRKDENKTIPLKEVLSKLKPKEAVEIIDELPPECVSEVLPQISDKVLGLL